MTTRQDQQDLIRREFTRQAEAVSGAALAATGATAGMHLHLAGDNLLFEHTAALTVAVKRWS